MERRRDDGPEFTLYVLGVGASHEGGVPLSAQILPIGHRLLEALKARRDGAPGGDDYLARLDAEHLWSSWATRCPTRTST
jgi:hypothetical protein